MKEIILASASPRRSELLKQIGVKFNVIPSEEEEKIDLNLNPEEIVQSLSYAKALSVAKKYKGDSLVIGADTIVVKDGILGKPADGVDAFRMLKLLQGEWHSVITGISIIESSKLNGIRGFEKTRVKMKSLSDKQINSYIETGEPNDKAGAYGIQGMGSLLVEKIEGCYFNIVGLPLSKLADMLQEFGIYLL